MASRIVKCPECEHPNVSRLKKCTNCGAPLDRAVVADPSDSKDSLVAKILFWTSPVWIIWVGLTLLSKYDERQEAITREQRIAEDQQRTIISQRQAAQQAEEERKEQAAREARKLAQKKASEERDAQCRKDWACWVEKNSLRAIVACQPKIEAMAKHDFKWTDGWLEPKFTKFRQTRTKDRFVYMGDHVQFQNGFGAWQRHSYHCIYDTVSEKVIDVHVELGRLK